MLSNIAFFGLAYPIVQMVACLEVILLLHRVSLYLRKNHLNGANACWMIQICVENL